MRREGRMHGSNVRVGKREWGHALYGSRQKLSSKPTNQSKCTLKRPVGVQSVATGIGLTEKLSPLQKTMGKSKSAFKAKDLDITRNHLLQDWSIYQRDHVAVEECDCLDDDCEQCYGEEDADVGYDEETMEQQAEEEEEFWMAGSSRDRARTEMVLPIESLLAIRRRKSASKTAHAAVPGHEQEQDLSTVGDHGEAAESGDEFENWWGLGFYDGEDVPDDWFLISEAEGFVA